MLWLDLERSNGSTLTRQIHEQLVARILAGGLRAGQRLPSSRQLADDHGVARNIVLTVYEQLVAEGFLESRAGSGTYVAALRPLRAARAARATGPAAAPVAADEPAISFICGTPDLRRFPRAAWAAAVRQVTFFRGAESWGYAPPAGCPSLRAEIAAHLLRLKGMRCDPERIVVTGGTAHALMILGMVFAARRPGALVEDPVAGFVPTILRHTGHAVRPVPVDAEGMVVGALPARSRAGMIFVTPSHQFPLGGTLPMPRRLALLDHAERAGLHVLEDDYDGEFRYSGAPVSPLWRLAPERVVHLGTFSKTLAPALRLGYLVLPAALVGPTLAVIHAAHLWGSRHTQEALAEFLRRGHFDRHVVRMQRHYRRRMRTLVAALHQHCGDRVSVSGHTTGSHLVATFRGVRWTPARRARLAALGVRVDTVDDYAFAGARHPGALALGFGHLTAEEIDEGVRRIASVL